MIQETINRVEVPVGGGSPGGPVSWNSVTGKPSTFAPSAHKSTHATGGSDALAPADISALPDDIVVEGGDASTNGTYTKNPTLSNTYTRTGSPWRIELASGGSPTRSWWRLRNIDNAAVAYVSGIFLFSGQGVFRTPEEAGWGVDNGTAAGTGSLPAPRVRRSHQHQVFNSVSSGFVPSPATGDEVKFLKGNGSWALPSPADIGAATAAQGAKADNSIQKGDNDLVSNGTGGFNGVTFGLGGQVATIYNGDGGGGVILNPSSITLYDGCSLQFTGLGATQTQTNFRNHIGAVGLSTDSYVIARPGDNLATKYGQAKVLTPNGNARSATNRASLIVFPGVYSISAELAIDTEFVDIVGLGAQTQKPAVFVTTNTLNVTANNVRVSGISVGTQAFKIGNNKPLQVFENCTGGVESFGRGGIASGTFTSCTGGDVSFGGDGIASGTFTSCTGGENSFGSGGDATGIFTNCIASGEGGFGGNGGNASGIFTNCTGGNNSFGGDGTLSGELISCRLVGSGASYETPSGSGIIRFCLDGDNNIVNAG